MQEFVYPRVSGLLLAGAAILLVYASTALGLLSPQSSFVLLTIVLLFYLAFEVNFARRQEATNWLINPAVLASFVTFFLGYGLSSIIFLFPNEFPGAGRLMEKISFESLAVAATVTVIAAVGMWNGYHANFGKFIVRTLRQSRLLGRLLRRGLRVRWSVILLCAAAGISVRLLQIWLGVYGYLRIPENSSEYISYLQYLSLASNLGSVALIAGSLSYFGSKQRTWFQAAVLAAIFGCEFVFGMLSGFKSQVVFPFILLGISYYVARGKVPKLAIMGAFLSVVFAYQVIEPFRVVRNTNSNFQSTDIGYVSHALLDIIQGEVDPIPSRKFDIDDVGRSLATRTSYVGYTAYALDHEEISNASTAPNFLGDIFLSPLYATVPRIIWTAKPKANLGAWFYDVVVGGEGQTALGMGPIAYLWFAGGAIAVFLGFMVLGVVQRVAYDYLAISIGGGGTFIYLAVLLPITKVSSGYDTIFTNLIRLIPIAVILQYMIFSDEQEP